MRTTHILMLCSLICLFFGHPLNAQICGPEPVVDSTGFEGSAFFNYGSSARIKSTTYRSAVAVGQTFIGYTENVNKNSTLGFYARYFLPPFALKVKATQGDLLDRIQVTWEIDALGPSPNDGFNIYRDGIFLQTVGANIRSYNDFNVIAGRPYRYCVQGLNLFGEGVCSEAIGFQVPNGVVTGWVSTQNGTAVPGATVILTPMQGFSAKFDAGDGAFAMSETGTNPFLPALDSNWTMTFWIKTTSATNNAKLIAMKSSSLYLRALNSPSGHEGVVVATTSGGTPFLSAQFPDSTKNEWHHLALTYDGNNNKGRLYLDGVLAAIAPMNPILSPDTLNFGALAGSGTWKGRLDEVRIYHHKLDELDFDQIMEGTTSSETPYLTHYWKMDEELGVKSYDIVSRQKLYFCGAVFDPDRPPVHTAGITNADGYYMIESASYGTGTTFLAKPMKNFYMHRSLKFEKADNDYATLPDFSITAKATIELWVNSAGPDGAQCVLSKKWGGKEFRLILNPSGLDNQIRINLNGTSYDYGLLGSGFQHLAFTWDSLSRTMAAYKNGILLGTSTFPLTVSGNWSDPTNDPWYLGKRFDGTQPFGGLIDEVAVYDTILSPAIIMDHFQNPRDMQEAGLRVYFPMDEGSGNKISNVGSVLLNGGITTGTEWSPLAAHQVVEPHVFTPGTSQVTLNPSVTSVDQVNFTDRSTIAVSGYVRYKNTDCFANNVEILVNGTSFSPKVITDSTGKFVIDFDPGTSAILTPVFKDHVFVPASWEVTNLSSPIAGILFTDLTTRKITGKVTGGECHKSIIHIIQPPGDVSQSTVCIVKVSSVDGCLERQIQIHNPQGNFEFDNLPPLEKMTVAVVEHSDPLIKEAFQTSGGSTVDLSKRDTLIDFIYTAPPQVEIVSGLDPVSLTCDKIVLDQFELDSLRIKLKEHYLGGDCYLDTANFHIINGFADEVVDSTMSDSMLTYRFRVSGPNPSPPFLKTLQIIGTTPEDREASLTVQAIVTGILAKENTFTTALPETPTLILHDPPGDGSYAYLEKNNKVCQQIAFNKEVTAGAGATTILDLGPDIKIPTFFGIPDVEWNSEIGPTLTATTTMTKVQENAVEVCTSFDQRISTSEDDIVVGGAQGGDVYVGGGLNINFGFADVVFFDEGSCMASDSVNLIVAPGDYATTFMYTEFYIKNSVLPDLQKLADLATDMDERNKYLESIARWNLYINNNAVDKAAAKFVRNISFDAGTSYEYSETSDSTTTQSVAESVNLNLDQEFTIQTYVLGIGGGVTLHVETEQVTGNSVDGTTAAGVTTGYVLKDDDPSDAFTMDVGIDSVYKTPAFKLKAGKSSCPWEPGTANRQAPNLQLDEGSHFEIDNVPANEAATFHLKLGNLSATNEGFTYDFTSLAEHNPDGAIIKLNGQPLNYLADYIIPYDSSQSVTITVERGPEAYDYDDLLVAEISECQYERDLTLGLSLEEDTQFISIIPLSVHFIRPCSEVNINVPQQDWVIFPDPLTDSTVNDNILRITVSGYDTTERSFELIRLQYRPSDGDGAWINIPDIAERYNHNWVDFHTLSGSPATLGPDFTQFYWNSTGLKDGPYEIRALAACSGDATDRPGYSQVIKGRIDREPPHLVGVPQPSDGVLQVGDEISFTFNKPINCHKLIQADMVHPNNVGLYNKATNHLIDSHITCGDNKIVIDPLFENNEFENHVLRAQLHNIEDLTGNKLDSTKWEFYVDRNELAWLTDSAGITKYDDETKSISVKIHNRGGYPVPFTIQDIPNWVHVTPDAGTLVANEIRDIEFSAADTLDLGWFKDSIVLHTETGQNPFFMGGDEPLPFAVRNICRPPDWEVDPTLYQQTMTFCLQFKINDTLSTDAEDQVAVFIEGQLRGTAKLIHSLNNKWIAFVTVYGNTTDAGKPLTFEVFDASACLHYPVQFTAGDIVTFTANGTQGTPNVPRVLINNGTILHEIPIIKGWNWISFNLGFPDSTINQVLNNISNPNGDLIKDQTTFSVFNNNVWSGSMDTIGHKSLYMYQAQKPNTIKIIGTALNPSAEHIPVVTGWNWIGYIPTYKLPVNAALASLPAVAGDVIKSQTAFAQYVGGTTNKWFGNLTSLQAPNGYLLRMTNAGTLTYPPQTFTDDHSDSRNAEVVSSFWQVEASLYEHNMTLIGIFKYDDLNATTEAMELGAFVGDELRGSGEAVYIDYLDAYMFFLTCYANTSGEQLHFKLYDGSTGEIQNLQEKMFFLPNDNEGSIADPVPFSLQTTSIEDVRDELSFGVQPNPFNNETACHFVLPSAQDVQLSISDMNGKIVYATHMSADAGMNKMVWKGCSTSGIRLASGIYVLRLKTENGVVTQKVVLER